MDPAVAAGGQRLVDATLAAGRDRHALPCELVFVAAVGELGLRLRHLALALDVDAPSGELARQACVLAFLADRQRELIVGHDDGR